MAGLDFFYIIVPEASENIIPDSSFEVSSSGTTVVGSTTRSLSTVRKLFDLNSLLVTPSSGLNDGIYLGSYTIVAGSAWTFSIYGFWALDIPYQIRFANTSGTTLGTATTFTGKGTWERKEVTYTPGTTSVRLYVTKNNSSSVAPYNLDGAQLENKPYATTYINGNRSGCFWNGKEHASTSERYANYRGAGRKVVLSTYDAYVTDMSGVGTPEVEPVIMPYGYDPGGIYQGTLTKDRVMTIGVSISGGPADGTSLTYDLNSWHSNMEAVFNLIKPDLVVPQQPFILGYQHSGKDLEIECVYAGGVDLQNETLKDISQIAFQLKCPFPYWVDPIPNAAIISNSTYILADAGEEEIYVRANDGTWASITPGTNSFDIYVMYIGQVDGNLYVGGSITTIGGVSATNIAMYNFNTKTWSALGTGCNGIVRAIVQIDNGNLIIGGDFTTANGVTTRSIARWNGTTMTIVGQANAFNASPTPSIRVLKLDPISRDVVVGGVFASAGASGANEAYCSRIVVDKLAFTLSWAAGVHYGLAASGTGSVNDICFFGKYMWITGKFTSAGVSPARTTNGIARLNTINPSQSEPDYDDVGTGFNSTTAEGTAIVVDDNGVAYVTGNGYTSVNGVTHSGVMKYDGYQWSPATVNHNQNSGVYGTSGINQLLSNQNFVYFNSIITSPITPTFRFAKLIGSNLVKDGLYTRDFNGAFAPLYAFNQNNNELICATNNEDNLLPSITQINNLGSANCFPVIRIKCSTNQTQPGFVAYIKNVTNGSSIRLITISTSPFELTEMSLKLGEIVTIDTRIGKREVKSNIRGNAFSLDDTTQLESFFLSPGINIIESIISLNDAIVYSHIEVSFYWNECHWTFNGGHS